MIDDIASFVSRYLPYAALVFCVSLAGEIIQTIGFSHLATNPLGINQIVGVFLEIAAAVSFLLAFFWLVDHRRLGWNTLIVGVIMAALAQLIMQPFLSNLPSLIIGLVVTLYLVGLVRTDYSE